MTNSVIRSILTAALLLVCFCAKPTQPEEPSYFVKTPMPDKLAELTALYLSGEILAPQQLYNRVHRDLEFIRQMYGNQYTIVQDNDFSRLFIASCFEATVDSATAHLFFDGFSSELDSLNTVHGLTSFDVYVDHGTFRVHLDFAGRRHPKRLLEAYLGLSGFINGHVCFTVFNGLDAPKTYAPRMYADTISYLFSLGNTYHIYMTSDPISMSSLYIWHAEYDSVTPLWWPEARKNENALFDWMNK